MAAEPAAGGRVNGSKLEVGAPKSEVRGERPETGSQGSERTRQTIVGRESEARRQTRRATNSAFISDFRIPT
jgi:hypothetical protein